MSRSEDTAPDPDTLDRELLLDSINAGFEALHMNATAWREELAERLWWDWTAEPTDS